MMRTLLAGLCLVVFAGSCASDGVTESIPASPSISTPTPTTAGDTNTTTSTPETATMTGPIETVPPPTSTTTTTRPEYVSVLPGDMACQDFATVELGFEAALGYWLVTGRPSDLDSDGDGMPCEHTEFPLDLPFCCDEKPPDSWVPGNDPFLHYGELIRPGMFCRDLAEEFDHPDYGFALSYWLWDGEPGRMDADGDGIPCETVYPEEFIRDVLEDPNVITVDPWLMTTSDLPTGMLCREAIWWRPFHLQVLGYFFSEGSPERMDADRDGIPCETVYPNTDLLGIGDTNLPPGLNCEELAEDMGGWYPDLLDYYLAYGRPTELDLDGDGYPCSPGWPHAEDVQYFKEGSPRCCAG